jgi:CheY-specific phosphatase CheX
VLGKRLDIGAICQVTRIEALMTGSVVVIMGTLGRIRESIVVEGDTEVTLRVVRLRTVIMFFQRRS